MFIFERKPSEEEDATVWARYSSAYFEQSAGRHACNNPYDQVLEANLVEGMNKAGKSEISYKEFLDIIRPSFAAVDSMEDMDAIMSRTHVILITNHGLFWRVASTRKDNVNFIEWPQNELQDLLAPEQVPIFKQYRSNPSNHQLPPSFHEDSVWSQEVLRRLICGEEVPKIITINTRGGLFGGEAASLHVVPALLPSETQRVAVKQEQTTTAWQSLKRTGPISIDLDSSPSPPKRARASEEAPPNPMLNGLLQDDEDQKEEEDDLMPVVGEAISGEEAEEVETRSISGGCGDENDASSYKDTCGARVLQWFGLPVVCPGSGPFSVAELNQMLAPLKLHLCKCSRKTLGVDGKYLCHTHDHFTGLHAVEGHFQYFDNGAVQTWSLGQVARFANCPEVTIFCLKSTASMPRNACDLTNFVGGSDGKYICPLSTCVRPGCCGNLLESKTVEATLYGLGGPSEVEVVTKQCSSRSCRTIYGYNYLWQQGTKINAVNLSDLKDGVVFINSKCGFTLDYLRYHEELYFRGHVATRAVSHAYNSVFYDSMSVVMDRFRKSHENAMFYVLAIQELEKLGLHLTIEIENELTDHALSMYKAFCHASIFPPSDRNLVKTIVGDGHSSVQVKCSQGPMKRAGRPRRKPRKTGYHANGWFFLCDPKTSRILYMSMMLEPEGNETATASLKETLWLYPRCNCFVYDRACSLMPSAQQDPELKQLKYYVVDWFHAHRHGKKCKCNPCTSSQVFHILLI